MAESQSDKTPVPSRLASRVFVGRQREMNELKVALEDALSGQGKLVMLVGEPGIGKTRTAQELASHAEVLGAQVLWGWCYEEEGAPPFWPWVQPIRSYLQQRDPDQLRSEMGPGAADIAEVISEVRAKLPGLEPPPALEPEQARFRLFDSITAFLKNAAQSRPLVLVLDDLHWADKPSLLLLQFLARQLAGSRLLMMGCYRDVELSRQHPLSDTLAQISRLPEFQRLLLRGLSQKDTGQFVEATAGIRPPPRLVEAVYAHTEGNPFFLKEVIQLLSERGELTAAEIGGPEGVRIPHGVREVIGQRLNRLSKLCNETLTTASIIGREFDFRLLHTLSGGPTEEPLLRVIDEALVAHLIEELPGGRERYCFSHALIQRTLAEELSASRKVRWHALIGEALEGLYGAGVEAHAAELAYHFAEAEAVLGTEKLVHYSLLAGEKALASYAWEEALAHFQRALAARGVPLAGTAPAGDSEAAALLFGLGRAQAATLEKYQMQRSVDTLGRALDYYVQVGDVAGAVAVGESRVPPIGGVIRTTQLIGRALETIPPDSHQAGRLWSRYGDALGIEEGEYEGAQQAFDKALAVAVAEGDSILEMWTLANSVMVDSHHGYHQATVQKGVHALALAQQLSDPAAELRCHIWVSSSLLSVGDPKEAQAHAEVALALVEKVRHRNDIDLALHQSEYLASIKGDWQAAREYNERMLAFSPHNAIAIGSRAMLEYQVGKFSQGQLYLRRLLEAMDLAPPGPNHWYMMPSVVIPLVARITGERSQLEIAEAAARAVLASPLASPFRRETARTGLALIAVQRGDVLLADEQYTHLESRRGTVSWYTTIGFDWLLGLLAQAMGNLDQAVTHFEDALVFCRKAGYRPELAWTCCDYADALLGRAQQAAPLPGDQVRAMALLNEALAIARELGMRPLMERVIARQEQDQSQRPTPTYPGGLSQREVEVLGLIATGKSNREIAEILFISLRTVANHVANILNKTGAANRAEAATYASRHGLV